MGSQHQRRWAIFDKEACSIVMACSHWNRLITGRPTTVYIDNTVAASTLADFKCPRPPRLQRWGIKLGSYLPYLRIAYRMGSLNDVADFMSRYPLYLKEGEHSVASIPYNLFDVLASLEVSGKPAVYLSELRNQKDIETVREAEAACSPAQLALLGEYHQAKIADEDKLNVIRADERLATCVRQLPRESIGHLTTLDVTPEFEGSDVHCNALLGTAREHWLATEAEFAAEQRKAQEEMTHWERYVTTFRNKLLHGRSPVVYDFFCGEGTFSRGAVLAGAQVIGFDIQDKPHTFGMRAVSRLEGGKFERTLIPEMRCVQQDLTQDELWQYLETKGYAPDCTKPDTIHASPPCKELSGLRFLGSDLLGPEPEPHIKLLLSLRTHLQYDCDRHAKTDLHYKRRLQPNTLDSVGGIQVGGKALLRHGSAEYAAMLKTHGYSPLRAFRVVEIFAEYNALRVDTRGTGIQPVMKVTSCKRAPEDWWIFDDSSLTSGTFAAPATTVAMARGCDSVVRGMLDMAKARYYGAIEGAKKESGAKRSKVKTNASAIQDVLTHVVEKDRPSRRRPPMQRVIAAILTEERHARRVCDAREPLVDDQ
eukprot:5059072-Pleurochrysis_carterae.AAC.1